MIPKKAKSLGNKSGTCVTKNGKIGEQPKLTYRRAEAIETKEPANA